MIDRQQTRLIEVNGFFQWLHEAEAQLAVFLSDRAPINLDVFGGTRNIAFVGCDPVSHDTRAKHVVDQLVMLAVPHKQSRTRTAAPIDLQVLLLLIGGYFDFVLQDTRGPQHANHVGLFRLAETNIDRQ